MNLTPTIAAVVYAGLAGTLLALLVATATNRWSLRVFFLLALRLAIGWHFMFEGLYKVNTHLTGPTDSNPRAFSSEPYFKVAPGPIGERMRKQFSDPAAEITTKIKAAKEFSPNEFLGMPQAEQAASCPEAVAAQFDALKATAVESMKAAADKELKDAETNEARALADIDAAEKRALEGKWTPEEIETLRAKGYAERLKITAAAESKMAAARERKAAAKLLTPALIEAAKKQPDSEELVKQIEAALKAQTEAADAEIKAAHEAEEKALAASHAAELKALKGEWTDAEKTKLRADNEAKRKLAKTAAEASREAARKKAEEADERVAKLIEGAKAKYARWVVGAEARPATLKFTSGDAALTAPQWIGYIEEKKHESKDSLARPIDGLGNGNGTDSKRIAGFRTDAITAEAELVKEANAFLAELKKDINSGKAVEETKEPSRGQQLDKVTMWFLVVVGACLMFGLFTRLACVFACGFLVMTYLAHPPFPWYPLPPNTEGNPVFVNKNVIEALALLALACYPTGRWLGLDALVLRPFCKYKGECPA